MENKPELAGAASFEVFGPAAYRVYQRDCGDEASVPFEILFADGVSCPIEAAIVSEDGDWERSVRATAVEGKYAGTLEGIPVGDYRLEFRAVIGDTVVTESIHPVYVGDLWVLAGQSNMAGAGKLLDVDDPQDGISCFYMGDRWDRAVEPLCWLSESIDPANWEVPADQLREKARSDRRDRTLGAGLGLPFAKEVMRHTGVPIGLVMCAHGGTSMKDWDSKRLHEGGASHYGALIRKVRKLGGRIKGCLWYQGEADAVLGPDHYLRYRDRMVEWIADLRLDVGDPHLPIVYAQLSAFYTLEPDATGWNRVQHEQFRLEGDAAHTAMVPTIDAALSDMIHLGTGSLREVGRRMAWRALELAYGRTVSLSGPRPVRFDWNGDRTDLTVVLSGINGALRQVGRVFGFSVESEGKSQPLTAELAEDGHGVLLRFERPVPHGSSLWHGRGYYPTVNVIDAKGIPLAVFGPVAV